MKRGSVRLYFMCKEFLTKKDEFVPVNTILSGILDISDADVTNWKQGKRNMNQIEVLRKISDNLGLSLDLTIGVYEGTNIAAREIEKKYSVALNRSSK